MKTTQSDEDFARQAAEKLNPALDNLSKKLWDEHPNNPKNKKNKIMNDEEERIAHCRKDKIAARCPACKAIVFIALNEPRVIDAECRRLIGQMAADGLSIEHMTIEQFRKENFGHLENCGAKS